jgi:hypothetical protein
VIVGVVTVVDLVDDVVGGGGGCCLKFVSISVHFRFRGACRRIELSSRA